MTFQTSSTPRRAMVAGFGLVVLGASVGLVTAVVLATVMPLFAVLALGGLLLVLPALVVRDPRAYWLFLLVLSIPLDIGKRTTSWLVDPISLLTDYGIPALGTLSLDLYPTDIALAGILVSWLIRLSLGQDRFYFPRIGYIFILYLAWTMITSLLQANSFYLSFFEWCREVLYFLSFIVLANNIVSRTQFRAITLALLLGLTGEAGTVIALYHFNIGTESFLFSGLYGDRSRLTKADTLSVGTSGEEKYEKRSAGTFKHPLVAAYFFEFGLAVVLAHLLALPRLRERILFGAILAAGLVALYLTYSRSGLLGFLVGSILMVPMGWWAGLISKRAFGWYLAGFAAVLVVSAPVLIAFIETRPAATSARWDLFEAGLKVFLRQPILGTGLNNSSTVLGDVDIPGIGGRDKNVSLHNHYLVVLSENGILGFLLYFGFFLQVVRIAFGSMRAAETDMKILLVGIVGALASVGVHNFGDAFWGNVTNSTLWLYAGIIVAISRRVQAEHTLPVSARTLAPTPAGLSIPGAGTVVAARRAVRRHARFPADNSGPHRLR